VAKIVDRGARRAAVAFGHEEDPMTVGVICNPNVATVGKETGIVEAAALMREDHVGDLVVVEHRGGRTVPVGILTDRDIVVGVLAKRMALDAVTVGDLMSRELLTVRRDHSVEFALLEMRRLGVRRAPVVEADGALIGILSIDDVIQNLAKQLGRLADLIRLEQTAEQLARP
jgi:CBS domain-containing protein